MGILGSDTLAEGGIDFEQVLDPMVRVEVVLVGPTGQEVEVLDSSSLLMEDVVRNCWGVELHIVDYKAVVVVVAHSLRIVGMEDFVVHIHLVDKLDQDRHSHLEVVVKGPYFHIHNLGCHVVFLEILEFGKHLCMMAWYPIPPLPRDLLS